jgi:TonB family protein
MYDETYPIYAEELPFKKYLTYSVFLHLALTALMLIGIWVQRSGEHWGGSIGGGGDSSVSVNLVANAGIPMPQPDMYADSHAVDPTKGLHKEELPPPPEIQTDAMKIPKFKESKPLPPSRPSKVFEKKTPEPVNAVPYGKGGSPSLPSGYANSPGPLGGGVQARGEGGGDFAGRYPWYVQSVQRLISQNWMQNTIDPSARGRAHAVATFTINRDGTVKNIRIAESSGNASFDNSAQRALLNIDHFPPLPPDYSGSHVEVTFDFLPPGAAVPR